MISPEQNTPPAITDKLRWCMENLGPKITAVAIDSDEPNASIKKLHPWSTSESALPADVAGRIELLHETASEVTEVYTAAVAALFIRGCNPQLDDEAIVMYLRESDPTLPEVADNIRRATRGFLD